MGDTDTHTHTHTDGERDTETDRQGGSEQMTSVMGEPCVSTTDAD